MTNLKNLLKPIAKPAVKPVAQPTTRKPEPSSILLLGQPGLGKTSFAAQFPKPEFILCPRDRSLITLMDNRVLPEMPFEIVKDWFQVLTALRRAAGSDSKTVVLESMQFVEQFCFNHTCALHFNNNFTDMKGWLNFSAGPRTAAERYWPALMDAMDDVLMAGKHFIMTGHSATRTVENVRGANYEADSAFCSKPIWQATNPIVQCICFIALEVEVETSENRAVKPKAVNEFTQLIMAPSAVYKGAKNKWNVQAPIRCGRSAHESYTMMCEVAHLNPDTLFRK